MRPGRKIGVGECLYFGEAYELQAEVLSRGSFGERRIRFAPVENFFQTVRNSATSLCRPIFQRDDRSADRERYQTVYARERGSVAAPTAGLHFTPEIFASLREKGIEIAELTLHVGLGTFQPIRVERVEDHRLHKEPYSISPATAERSIVPAIKSPHCGGRHDHGPHARIRSRAIAR